MAGRRVVRWHAGPGGSGKRLAQLDRHLEGDGAPPTLWLASQLLEEFGPVAVPALEERGIQLGVMELFEISDLRTYAKAKDRDRQEGSDLPSSLAALLLKVKKWRYREEKGKKRKGRKGHERRERR